MLCGLACAEKVYERQTPQNLVYRYLAVQWTMIHIPKQYHKYYTSLEMKDGIAYNQRDLAHSKGEI